MIALRLAGAFGADFALDVALDLPMTGVTCLLGPSGSGKTTILRSIAGLERIAGEVRFGDETWQDGASFVQPHRRRIGYVFQGTGLLPHLTVAGNLAYAVNRAGREAPDIPAIVDRTGIAALLDRRPDRLSGGEAQRAGIARALASGPRLLLLDEPLSALDSGARAEMIGFLAGLFAATGLPVIHVTHDEAEAARLADWIVRIDAGRVVASGPRDGLAR